MREHEHDEHSGSHSKHPQGEKYNVSIKSGTATPQSKESTRLTIIVTERETDNRIGQFQVIHDKLMHLVIVSDDLSYFAHVHPMFDEKERIFDINHIFPMAGRYKMWVDVKPQDGDQFVKKFDLDVDGKPTRQPIPVMADRNFTKNVATASGQQYKVGLRVPKVINARQETEIVFELSDSQGKPITDLEPLMAAGGHCVIITADVEEFLHVHPLEEVKAGWRGGPEVAFRAIFPSPGLYKAWGQFQHKGNVITVDFVLEAK